MLFIRKKSSTISTHNFDALKKIKVSNINVKLNYGDVKRKEIKKILIANRGEIACRVMASAKEMGIKTVAIYSEKDEFSKHVMMADESACVGPAPSAQSYLNLQKIVDICKELGVDAVHPGYGFMSENEHFVAELEKHDISFIGPNSGAIHAMGDKIQSKKIAKEAGVNLIPGFIGEVDTMEDVLRISNEIGYPVMIKASAGGGGKGMRVAWNDKEAKEGYRMAKQESLSSFGDDRILIEKFIDNPRHIEIQVLCDKHGHGIYLNERECSIQRRNQKVVEEAPSSFVTPELRKEMGEQALMLCKAVDYVSAGTVEFLVDSNRNFYFLEMNTRLQVEHPITEYITGVDIVEWMIKVASGEKLSLSQDDIGVNGWAIESRIYAEDPFRGFLPSIGRLVRYKEPLLEDTRVDSGVVEGGEISIYYDPLISKLITFGNTRDLAIKQMKRALDSYVIRGLQSNIAFCRDIMENEKFVSGDISTNFIPQEYPNGFHGHNLSENDLQDLLSAAVTIDVLQQIVGYSVSKTDSHNEDLLSSDVVHKVLKLNGERYEAVVSIDLDTNIFIVNINHKNRVVDLNSWKLNDLVITCSIDNQLNHYQYVSKTNLGHKITFKGTDFSIDVLSPLEDSLVQYVPEDTSNVANTSALVSPMAGRLVSVAVSVGDEVEEGQELVCVEAMKMQNVLRSSRKGIIKTVKCQPGSSVGLDEILIEFEE